jgi:hypothetical protein
VAAAGRSRGGGECGGAGDVVGVAAAVGMEWRRSGWRLVDVVGVAAVGHDGPGWAKASCTGSR